MSSRAAVHGHSLTQLAPGSKDRGKLVPTTPDTLWAPAAVGTTGVELLSAHPGVIVSIKDIIVRPPGQHIIPGPADQGVLS